MSNDALITSYTYSDTWATDSTALHKSDGWLYPMISLIIPGSTYTSA